ncbi:MAG: profilin [Promethearchaeia archaeon]
MHLGVTCLPRRAQGADGACIAKTNQCLLLGMYGDGMQPGNCNVTVSSS